MFHDRDSPEDSLCVGCWRCVAGAPSVAPEDESRESEMGSGGYRTPTYCPGTVYESTHLGASCLLFTFLRQAVLLPEMQCVRPESPVG